MNIILKTSLKNIFGKPFRTLMVVFAIFVCSVSAMLSFDMVSSIKGILNGIFAGISRADFMVSAGSSGNKGLPDGFPESDVMILNGKSEILYKDIEGEYNYVTTDYLDIYAVDFDEAADMRFIEPMTVGFGEAAITTAFSRDYGYGIGDKFTVHDRADEDVELEVVSIIPSDTKNVLLSGNVALINRETQEVLSAGRKGSTVFMIDVLNDDEKDKAMDMMKELYPTANTFDFNISMDSLGSIDELTSYIYLLFAITFLLVIFVTASICNRIVSERMAFIGTLRSLGMSAVGTARVLLLENILYALLGSIPAVAVYGLIRIPILKMFSGGTTSDGNKYDTGIPSLSVVLVVCVILCVMLIECLIPLRAILKALKTSIRDIIFDNRDTAYRFSKAGLFAGLAMILGAFISIFFSKSMPGAIVCLLCSVTALALLFPWIFKGVTDLIKRLAEKTENAGWSLASVEAISRKSTVGSGVLCVTAAAMSVIIFAFAQSASDSVGSIYYTCDVKVTCNDNIKKYSFIDKLDTVTGTEVIYTKKDFAEINDSGNKDEYCTFYAMPDGGYKYYTFFSDLPDKVDDGSILVCEKYASAHGFNAGDVIKITYDSKGVFPIEREYRIAAFFKQESYDGNGCFIMPYDEYYKIYREKPGEYLIKCDDPDYVAQAIKTYAAGAYSEVKTMDEMIADDKASTAKFSAIMTAVIIIALGMTLVGMISNQLIGFEGRRKECAVLLSTAMGKSKLSGILVREMLITSLTASGLGTLTGVMLTVVINNATSNSTSLDMTVNSNPLATLLFFVMLVAAFTGTVLFPIKNLRKMKIAEQIKYE